MKILVVGLDGASLNLIHKFKTEGILPSFSKLIDGGLTYPLNSTVPPHTAPGWVSSLTGVNPGKHGIYQFWDTQSASYVGKFMGSNEVKVPFVWQILNEHGYSTGMINIPMTHPPKWVDGFMLSWPLSNTLQYCYPPDLVKEIANNQGHYVSDLLTMFNGDTNYINMALDITRKRLQTVKYLLENKPVDFLMTVFTEIDRISHFYWQYMQDEKADSNMKNAVKNIYIETDKVLGEIINCLEEDTLLMIYSDHGFEQGVIDFYVQTFLMQNELLFLKKEPSDYVIKDSWFELLQHDGIYSVDWDKTIAYMAAPGSYGININLKGRQEKGIVESDDYGEVCQKVIDHLKNVKNPLNNKPLFKEVKMRSEVYNGPCISSAPDIIMIPEKYGIMVHHKITENELFCVEPEQKGMHNMEGIFILYGENIQNIKHRAPKAIWDIAPSILDLFNIQTPLYMDGTSVFSTRAKSKAMIYAQTSDTSSYCNEEESEIKKRLKNLGYY